MTTEYEVPSWETGMQQLSPNVYAYIQAKGSWFRNNAGLIVGKEYALVVDSLATVGLTQTFINEIRKVTNKPIRYLVNTHHHGDHIWGNHLFTGADIICHRRCREEVLAAETMDPDLLGAVLPEFDFHGIVATPANITFEKQLTLYMDDQEVQLIYYGPGHTVGDIIVYLPKENIVFAADLIFLYSTPLAMEGSFGGWIKNMDAMANLNAKTYVPGHGPVCGKEGLMECREYLVYVQGEAHKRFDKGMSVDEAAKDIELGRFRKWAEWERIVANLERLQREFRGEDPATSKLDVIELWGRMTALGASG
jgi:cyclase